MKRTICQQGSSTINKRIKTSTISTVSVSPNKRGITRTTAQTTVRVLQFGNQNENQYPNDDKILHTHISPSSKYVRQARAPQQPLQQLAVNTAHQRVHQNQFRHNNNNSNNTTVNTRSQYTPPRFGSQNQAAMANNQPVNCNSNNTRSMTHNTPSIAYSDADDDLAFWEQVGDELDSQITEGLQRPPPQQHASTDTVDQSMMGQMPPPQSPLTAHTSLAHTPNTPQTPTQQINQSPLNTPYSASSNNSFDSQDDGDYNVEEIESHDMNNYIDDDGTDSKYDHANAQPVPVSIDTAEDDSDFYGLPSQCRELFAKLKGVVKPYDWQHEVLTHDALKSGKNFVYSLPTSGGKTLIAEIMLLRTVLLAKKKALFVLPFVSLVEEKRDGLEAFADQLHSFYVEGYHGNHGHIPVPQGIILCVATIEKANSIINNLLEENRLTELGCIVVDELHMVGENSSRASMLENMLSKVIFAESKLNHHVQIIGMSATIPNLGEVAEWLHAESYVSDFRPVPLVEYIKVDNRILNKNRELVRQLKAYDPNEVPIPASAALDSAQQLQSSDAVATNTPKGGSKRTTDPDHVTLLCTEVVPEHSVLIFCATKRACEQCARHLASTLPASYRSVRQQEKLAILHELKAISSTDETLYKTIPYGIAFHHSGLTFEEREIIENAYRRQIICILTCTSTLAAGVNLPAKRVLFRTPYIGPEFLTKSRYLQMSGRAGRAGIDTSGESFLIVKASAKQELEMAYSKLVQKPLEPLCSSVDEVSMRRVVLELVCCGLILTLDDIRVFAQSTLCYTLHTKNEPLSLTNETNTSQSAAIENDSDITTISTCTDSTTESTLKDSIVVAKFLQAFDFLLESRFVIRKDTNLDASANDTQSQQNTTTTAASSQTTTDVTSSTDISNLIEIPPTASTAEQTANESQPKLPTSGVSQSSQSQQSYDSQRAYNRNGSNSIPLNNSQNSSYQLDSNALASMTDSQLAATDSQSDAQKTNTSSSQFETTPFGIATFKSSFSLEEASFVSRELKRAQDSGLVLSDELHLCYLVTPIGDLVEPDWMVFFDIFNKHLPASRRHIGGLVGLNEAFLVKRAMTRGRSQPSSQQEEIDNYRIAKRFYSALILCDLVNEKTVFDVEGKYNVNRGVVQSLMTSASMFAGMMVRFCQKMNWWALECVLAQYAKRLGFGVKADILELAEIHGVAAARARALWNAGFREVRTVAMADPQRLAVRLQKKLGPNPLSTATTIVQNAKKLLNRKANDMRRAADEIEV